MSNASTPTSPHSPYLDSDQRSGNGRNDRSRNRSEASRAYCEARAPLLQLPEEFSVNPEAMKLGHCPPTLCFGLGVRLETVFEYARKKGLVDESSGSLAGRMGNSLFDAVSYLEKLTRAYKLRARMPVSLERIYVISLYDNYTKYNDAMDEENEKEVLEMLRKELGLPEDEPAKWYFQHP